MIIFWGVVDAIGVLCARRAVDEEITNVLVHPSLVVNDKSHKIYLNGAKFGGQKHTSAQNGLSVEILVVFAKIETTVVHHGDVLSLDRENLVIFFYVFGTLMEKRILNIKSSVGDV